MISRSELAFSPSPYRLFSLHLIIMRSLQSFTSAETYYDVLRLSPSDSPSDLEMAVAQRLAVFREAGGPDYDWDRERTGKSRFGLDKIGNEKQLRKMAETLLSSTARRRYGNYGDYFRISVANMTETSIMATNFQAHFMAILSAIFFYLVGHLLTSSASFKCARPLVAFSCLGMLMAEFGLRETESVTIFGLLPFQIIRALHAFFPFVLLASIAIGRRFLLKPQLTDEKLRTLAKLQLLILKQQRDARS